MRSTRKSVSSLRLRSAQSQASLGSVGHDRDSDGIKDGGNPALLGPCRRTRPVRCTAGARVLQLFPHRGRSGGKEGISPRLSASTTSRSLSGCSGRPSAWTRTLFRRGVAARCTEHGSDSEPLGRRSASHPAVASRLWPVSGLAWASKPPRFSPRHAVLLQGGAFVVSVSPASEAGAEDSEPAVRAQAGPPRSPACGPLPVVQPRGSAAAAAG